MQALPIGTDDITLCDRDGALYHGDDMLLHVYAAGDCDRAPWPFKNDRDRRIAAAALYDLRECSPAVPMACTVAILPDGERFAFDEWVS